MDQFPVSKFKARCLAILARVCKTGEAVLVTRFGKPLARITAPEPARLRKRDLARAAGTMTILGDIVGPVSDPADWNALR